MMNITTLSLNKLTDAELIKLADVFYIFVNQEAKPSNECSWFYKLVGVHYGEEYLISEESGKTSLCHCEECSHFGAELSEYFSAYLALDWAKQNTPDISILLWVSSKKFLFTLSKELFGHCDRYRCAFLRTLFEDLGRLLSMLDVVVVEYSYANKDIIPVFF